MDNMKNDTHLEAIRNVLLTMVLAIMTVGVIRTILHLI